MCGTMVGTQWRGSMSRDCVVRLCCDQAYRLQHPNPNAARSWCAPISDNLELAEHAQVYRVDWYFTSLAGTTTYPKTIGWY